VGIAKKDLKVEGRRPDEASYHNLHWPGIGLASSNRRCGVNTYLFSWII